MLLPQFATTSTKTLSGYFLYVVLCSLVPTQILGAAKCPSVHAIDSVRSSFDQMAKNRYRTYKPENIRVDQDGAFLNYYHRRTRIASGEVWVRNETLRFDIVVNPNWRGLGLYRLLMQDAVSRHPEIKSIPARMPKDDSANARLFFEKIFLDQKAAQITQALRSLANKQEHDIQNFRQLMIESFRSTPAYRVRARLGFENIEKIVIDCRNGPTLSFVVSKGPQVGLPKAFVAFVESRQEFFELTTSGGLLPVENPTSLGEYDLTKTPDYIGRFL